MTTPSPRRSGPEIHRTFSTSESLDREPLTEKGFEKTFFAGELPSRPFPMAPSTPKSKAGTSPIMSNSKKVRASQKLTLQQKWKFWNMSMRQEQTGPSGTQPKYFVNLTGGTESKGASSFLKTTSTATSDNAKPGFDVDPKAKDRVKNLFNKYTSPSAPVLKPAGKQTWSWGNLDKAGDPAKNTGTSMTGHQIPPQPSIFGSQNAQGQGKISRFFPFTHREDAAVRKFEKLPKFIREMIWGYTIQPQVVTISRDGAKVTELKNDRAKGDYSSRFAAKAAYQLPVVMHVCRESRAVGLRTYNVAFKEQLLGKYVYFDYFHDVLFFDDPEALTHFYGGTEIDYEPLRGFRYDMNTIHRSVRNIAIARVSNSVRCILSVGWAFNQYSNLETALVGISNWGLRRENIRKAIYGYVTSYNEWSDLITERKSSEDRADITVCEHRLDRSVGVIYERLEDRGMLVVRAT